MDSGGDSYFCGYKSVKISTAIPFIIYTVVGRYQPECALLQAIHVTDQIPEECIILCLQWQCAAGRTVVMLGQHTQDHL